MELLRRKIDRVLEEWKRTPGHKPLIVKGARQVGKTASIRQFARSHYDSVVEVNFVFQKAYRGIFDDGYEVDSIVKNLSLLNPALTFPPGKTLFFFDELQDSPDCATSLKAFVEDGHRCAQSRIWGRGGVALQRRHYKHVFLSAGCRVAAEGKLYPVAV